MREIDDFHHAIDQIETLGREQIDPAPEQTENDQGHKRRHVDPNRLELLRALRAQRHTANRPRDPIITARRSEAARNRLWPDPLARPAPADPSATARHS